MTSHTIESIDLELEKLSPIELELMLIHCYYGAYFDNAKKVKVKNKFYTKTQEYELMTTSFTAESKQKIDKLYKHLKNKVGDLYGIVYDFAHKQSNYKNLLMLV